MKIEWDLGTAYELFSSLYVIHDPGYFGVRASWAAGVRSRIPQEARELFTDVLEHLKSPVAWIYELPEPKTASVAVQQLESMDDAEVLPKLIFAGPGGECKDVVLRRVIEKRSWTEDDFNEIAAEQKEHHGKTHRVDRKKLSKWLEWLARPEDFGRRFVGGISEYYENFFREEEKRISPALKSGLEHAKALAKTMASEELLEELSQGIKSESFMDFETIVLIPSFWLSPFVMIASMQDDFGFVLFGARPHDDSLIPGETVPDSLSAGLQALSDHTRLKILKLISEQPLTQTEIAKKLRLRTPTINHHLKMLRMASLVTKAYLDEDPGNVRYSIRPGRVDELCESIKEFMGS
jgi:DNA-binding transcriptional ArsR family regulator